MKSIENNHLESLRVKAINNTKFEYYENTDDIDKIISDRLDSDSIELQQPGNNLDLSHLKNETKREIESLVNRNSKAFSTGTDDTGLFTLFEVARNEN